MKKNINKKSSKGEGKVFVEKRLPSPSDGTKVNVKKQNKNKSYKRYAKRDNKQLYIASRNPQITKNAVASLRVGDVRSASGPKTAVQNRLGLEYTSHGSTVIVPLSDVAIIGAAGALVSKALTRGMSEEYAAPSLQIVSDIIKSRALNADPVVTSVPGYLEVLCTAVSPKTVLHKGAAINYSWLSQNSGLGANSQQQYGNTNNTGIISYGLTQPNSGNPYGLPSVIANNGATDDQKKIAYTKLLSALAQGNNHTDAPLTESERKKLSYDSSAFAGQTVIDGFALGNQGGTIVRLGSEAGINFPVLSRFASVQSSFRDYNRACNVNTESGGGPMEMTMLTTQYRTDDLMAIKKPVIKFVDANSLMHVYFKTWQFALEAYAASPEFQLLVSVNNGEAQQALIQRCIPCTLEEAQLALRSEFMKTFADTQFGTQSLGPTTEANENWLGYACGVGTCPNDQIASLYMSSVFAENLRALSGVTVYDVADVQLGKTLTNAKKTRKLTTEEETLLKRNKIIRPFLPVLGSYLDAKLVESDYNVRYAQTLTVPLFRAEVGPTKVVNPIMSPMINGKKPGVKAVNTIRMNDGSCGNGYVALNDASVVGEIINAMNRSIERSAPYFVGLCSNTSQPSANILRQLGSNMFSVRDAGDSSTGAYFDVAKITKISYGFVPERVVEEQFKFVKPFHYYSEVRDDSTLKHNNDRETEIVMVGSKLSPVTLRETLDAVALLGTSDGTTSNLGKKLQWLDSTGQGGIFSDLAAAFNPLIHVGVNAVATGLDMLV